MFYIIKSSFKNIFSKCKMTSKKLLLSAAAAILAGAILVAAGLATYRQEYASIMLIGAVIPITLLMLLDKAGKRRTKAKIIILSIYFHIFWQIIQGINLQPIIIDLIAIGVIVFISRFNPRKRAKTKTTQTSNSISRLWE